MPPMNSSGMNAAISEMLIDDDREADLARALDASRAAANGPSPGCGTRSRSSRSRRRPRSRPRPRAPSATGCRSRSRPAHIAAQVPASDSGTVTPAARVGAVRRRNRNTTSITSAMVPASVSCMSCDAGADRAGAVGQDRDVDVGRDPALDLREQRADAVDRLDDVGVALLGDGEQHGRLAVEPGGRAAVARALLDGRDVGEPHDVAVGALDHQRLVVGDRAQLIVDADGLGQVACRRARRAGFARWRPRSRCAPRRARCRRPRSRPD